MAASDERWSLTVAVSGHGVPGSCFVAGVVGGHPLVLPPPDLLHLGEWREGTSPSRSLRTVRDSLPSYGSHSSALG